MLKQKEMKNEEKYDYKSLIQLIEETLKQTDSCPVTIKSILDINLPKDVNEEYFHKKIEFFAEVFAFRTIYNFKSLEIIVPLMITGDKNKGFLFPINLIMRNIITDFLTSRYVFTKFIIYQNSDKKDNEDLIEVFRSMNEIIYKRLIDSVNKEEVEQLKLFLPECCIKNKKKVLL